MIGADGYLLFTRRPIVGRKILIDNGDALRRLDIDEGDRIVGRAVDELLVMDAAAQTGDAQ